jgi:tetratricopeptide (TPR) repeat protein
MYLKGSKWRMTRRPRRRSNPWLIFLLLISIGGLFYVNQIVVPATTPLFVATPTATRSPESFLAEAVQYTSSGNLSQAILSYQQAILAESNNPSLYIELGRIQVLAGEFEAALTSAQNALLLNSNNAQAKAIQGWAQYFMGDTLAAEISLNQAIALDPNDGLAHAFYAEVLADQGKFEQAGDASRLAISLAPDQLETHRARGIVLELTGNYQDAIVEYQAALRINNNIGGLHLALGRNYTIIEEYELAEESFIKANSLNPRDPEPDSYLARTYARIGQFSKAVQYAELAVQDDPAQSALHGSLGIMLYRNGQRVEAVDELRLAVRGGTTADGVVVNGLPLAAGRVAEYYSTYVLALARTNQCGEALPIVQLILSNLPEDLDAVFNANEAQLICQENVGNPPLTPEEDTETGVTPTPEGG